MSHTMQDDILSLKNPNGYNSELAVAEGNVKIHLNVDDNELTWSQQDCEPWYDGEVESAV